AGGVAGAVHTHTPGVHAGAAGGGVGFAEVRGVLPARVRGQAHQVAADLPGRAGDDETGGRTVRYGVGHGRKSGTPVHVRVRSMTVAVG
ncbi:hypothetical protein, partial [Nocardia farcinica]|uniref:hypothetical protein n=1 Tax=Nocardia farcinica TaxID=37329 RepID=UPI002453EA3A